MKNNNRNILRRGSITVEASFIMPIVIMTIFALIYLSFLLHDRCIIQGTVDKVLHKAAISVKHDADIASGEVNYESINERGVFYLIFGGTEEEKRKIESYLQEEISKGLFLSRITWMEVIADKRNITIALGVENKIKLPVFRHLFNSYSYREVTENYPVHNPAETIRAMEVILETGSEIKGMEGLKEKMEQYFGKDD